MARAVTMQTTFNAGELNEGLWDRDELRYYATGVSYAQNVEVIPHGGFRQRDGMRDVGVVDDSAARLIPFKRSDGVAFDIVIWHGSAAAWSETAEADAFNLTMATEDILPELTFAQSLDTLLLFNRELESLRVVHYAATDWRVDCAPFENLPTYDFGTDINGADYTNAVAAVWEVEFVGLTEEDAGADPPTTLSVFVLTVSGLDTAAIEWDPTIADLATAIEAAILDLPNIGAGLTVVAGTGDAVIVTFSGDENIGDGWAVSGRVTNKADAAILARKTVVGVAPGEPLMSADRGWPQCGAFYSQRLLLGGLKSLGHTWMYSALGDYYNHDGRLTGDDGPAVVPMGETEGGETIEQLVPSTRPLIYTSEAEYWLEQRALSRNAPPNHIQSSTNGSKRGIVTVRNEGAVIFAQKGGGVLGENRYTDVDGNFAATDMSLLATHLFTGIADLALQKKTASTDGNTLIVVNDDGTAVRGTLLREQEITAFARLTSPGAEFIATAVNGRNEVSFITERPDGRHLERFEQGLLLDEAVTQSFEVAEDEITVPERFLGREIWIVADGDVFGPYTPETTSLTLPAAAESVTIGTWTPPLIRTLPPPKDANGNPRTRKGRIFTVRLQLIDTTSVAVRANGGSWRDVDLRSYGDDADVAELDQGFSGEKVVEGLLGFTREPIVEISQLRPGRLTVRSIKAEAVL